jgi:glycosyltransferase involved in cell wall biosynthesis
LKEKIKNVSAVICSWNAAESIVPCIQSLRENRVSEIILVDASSTDGTRELAQPLVDRMLTDPRQGLGAARNLGINATTGEYILNCGPDNVMPESSISRMIMFLEGGSFSGVSAVTVVRGSGYLSWAMNLYKQARYFPGERRVIGTPTLFDGRRLRAHSFDPGCSHSDDAELCERWSSQFGAKFAISNVLIDEVGQEGWRSILTRWSNYGVSDYEIYSAHRNSWRFRRKMESVFYPLREELFKPFSRLGFFRGMGIAPFLILITLVRYKSWIRRAFIF